MIRNAVSRNRLGLVVPPCPDNMVRVPGGLGIGCATPAWLATATPADIANLLALEPEEEAFYTASPATTAPASPGTVSTAPAAGAPASILTSPASWPWYYWAALAGGGLLLFSGKK